MQIIDHTTALIETEFLGFEISLVLKYEIVAAYQPATRHDPEEDEEVRIYDVHCNGKPAELTNEFLNEIKNAMADDWAYDIVEKRHLKNWHRRAAA